jgi:hypothetical protein
VVLSAKALVHPRYALHADQQAGADQCATLRGAIPGEFGQCLPQLIANSPTCLVFTTNSRGSRDSFVSGARPTSVTAMKFIVAHTLAFLLALTAFSLYIVSFNTPFYIITEKCKFPPHAGHHMHACSPVVLMPSDFMLQTSSKLKTTVLLFSRPLVS